MESVTSSPPPGLPPGFAPTEQTPELAASLPVESPVTGSPRGRPPVFIPERALQLPPWSQETHVDADTPDATPEPAAEPKAVEATESTPERGHPLADAPPPPPPAATSQPAAAPPPPPPVRPTGPPPPRQFYDTPPRWSREDDFSVAPRLPHAYMFKLLGDSLSGVIMGCTDHTKAECLDKGIFGLPAKHWDYLQNVKEGVTFYLFNYSRRSLHGIFRSTEPAQWNLNPHGWRPNQNMATHFPAQIRVERLEECPPLKEEEYGPILEWKNNYIENTTKFSFELDDEQVERLNAMFRELKEREPERGEPPVIGRMSHPGYGLMHSYGYGMRQREGPPPWMRSREGPPPWMRPRGGRFGAPRGPFGRMRMSGEMGFRTRPPPMGANHPLARRPAGRPPRSAVPSYPTPRMAAGPPPPGMSPRPVVTPPPGMGAPPPTAEGLPVRPPAASTLPPPITAPLPPTIANSPPPGG